MRCLLSARSSESALHPRRHRPPQRSPATPWTPNAGHLGPFAVAAISADGLWHWGRGLAGGHKEGGPQLGWAGQPLCHCPLPWAHLKWAGAPSSCYRGRDRWPLPPNAACSTPLPPIAILYLASAGDCPVTYKVQPHPHPAFGDCPWNLFLYKINKDVCKRSASALCPPLHSSLFHSANALLVQVLHSRCLQTGWRRGNGLLLH